MVKLAVALPDFAPGTLVVLNSRGTGLQRKLSQYNPAGGIAFDSYMTPLNATECAAPFEWLGTDNGRNAKLRSTASGREGMLGRDLLRVYRPRKC